MVKYNNQKQRPDTPSRLNETAGSVSCLTQKGVGMIAAQQNIFPLHNRVFSPLNIISITESHLTTNERRFCHE